MYSHVLEDISASSVLCILYVLKDIRLALYYIFSMY